MPRAALLALLLLLLAPAAARADLLRPDGPPSTASPDPAWVRVGDAIALDYAAQNGWADACAGREIRIDVYPDLDAAQGRPVVAYADLGGSCSMAVEEAQLQSPDAFCDTYVHERLHLVRGDAWHDPVPGHPLYTDVLPYAPCHDAWRPQLSRGEAVARVRARVGAGWRWPSWAGRTATRRPTSCGRPAAAQTGAGCSARSSRSGATATAHRPRSPAWRSGPRGRPAPAAP